MRRFAFAEYADAYEGYPVSVGIYEIPDGFDDDFVDTIFDPAHREDGSVVYRGEVFGSYRVGTAPKESWTWWEQFGFNGGSPGLCLTDRSGGVYAETPCIHGGIDGYPNIQQWLDTWDLI